MKKSILMTLSLGAALCLSACGGGDDDEAMHEGGTPAVQSVIPVQATTSSVSAFEFVNGMAAQTSDDSETSPTADEVLAVSETDEPDARF
jgi:hypothetical protein